MIVISQFVFNKSKLGTDLSLIRMRRMKFVSLTCECCLTYGFEKFQSEQSNFATLTLRVSSLPEIRRLSIFALLVLHSSAPLVLKWQAL